MPWEANRLREHIPITALTVACLMAFFPTAGAEPLFQHSVQPGPEGQNDEGDGYYLYAAVVEPEGPRRPARGDDCSPERPQSAPEGARRLVAPFLASQPDPRAFNGVSTWFPSCVAMTTSPGEQLLCGNPITCGSAAPVRPAYVAWNVADGRVYVEPAGSPLLGTRAATAPAGAFTLQLPLAVGADCEDCPPGNLLA